MRVSGIRNYDGGGYLNKADGLNPKIFEYSKKMFITKMDEYLRSDDKHFYISTKKKNENGGYRYTEYCTTIAAFDIETTSLYVKGDKRSIPYIWQLAVQDYVCYGRHFEDIVEVFDLLHKIFETDVDRRLIIWVHNLPFEFQFIKKYFKWFDIFLLEERKPLKAITADGIEFRCSLALSGMSLEDLSKNGIKEGKVQKLVGNLDYDLIRHEKTPLTDEELLYCVNDDLVVVEYITEQVNELYDGDITKLPTTKTGAVRSYVKENTINHEDNATRMKYLETIHKLTISVDEYFCLTRAFAGGFTHANPKYVGETLEDVGSGDESSAYPAVMCMEKFPMSKGVKIKIGNDWDLFYKLLDTGLMVFDIGIYNLESKYEFEHILQAAKCRDRKKARIDNNRIVSAEYVATTMTSVDFKEFLKYYMCEDIIIPYVWYYEADYLPKELVRSILQLYVDKTKLKNVGQDLLYNLKKSNLNSTYGMMVMAIFREEVEYNQEQDTYQVRMKKFSECTDKEVIEDVEKLYEMYKRYFSKDMLYNYYISLDNYNKNNARFLFYPWGVFVTSYARQRLQDFILETGDDHVYSDTDSDKFLNMENHLKDIENFNGRIDEKIDAICKHYGFSKDLYYPEDIKGIKHPLGYFENESGLHPYRKFKTLGAKRYLVEKWNKKLNDYEIEITCAGINKKKGSRFISKQVEPFEFFNDLMVVDENNSGRMTATYIDNEYEFDVKDYNGVVDHCLVKSGLHLEKSAFQLKMETSYKKFLGSIENLKYLRRR